MTDQNPAFVPPFRDRSVGLTVFGIFTILLGCVIGLLALTIPLSQAMVPQPQKMDLSALMMAVVINAVVAVGLIWLGIGSIMARRWARALLLIFSWSWLAIGVFEIIAMGVLMPKMLATMSATARPGQPALPPAAIAGVMVFMFVFLGIFFVLMPAIWTFFYSSRHVKATCEARDPVPRWTDACPLPVLALCLWAWLCLPMMLFMPFSGHMVMPFFGMFLTGAPATIFCFVLAVCWGVAGWLMYRLDARGWWLVLIAIAIAMISGLVTFSQHDMMEMYRLMNYPPAQIEQIQRTGLFEGNAMMWMMVVSMVPFLGYLFFIRRYFRRTA